MRAIDWMAPYKERYENFLNTGNPNTDATNAILLHSEGDGKQFPSVFALSDEEIQEKLATTQPVQPTNTQPVQPTYTQTQPVSGVGMPPPPPGNGCVPPPPPPAAEPQINLYLSVAGQNYGPYNYETCKQLVQNGQLTPLSIVWMDGMAAWGPAGQVPALQTLFAPPAAAPGMPPLPPMGGPTPPPPPAM
jgi:hypothetical protein